VEREDIARNTRHFHIVGRIEPGIKEIHEFPSGLQVTAAPLNNWTIAANVEDSGHQRGGERRAYFVIAMRLRMIIPARRLRSGFVIGVVKLACHAN